MRTVTVRLNDEEEKIENEVDLEAIQDYEKGLQNDEIEIYEHEKVMKMFAL